MPFSSKVKNIPGKLFKFACLILLVLFINACSIDLKKHFSSNETEMARDWPRTDFSKRSFEFDEIVYQALPKDAIPAIDKPVFKKPSDIGWINPDEPVIVVKQGDQAKAYPLQIMIHHEIVNDYINNAPIVVTFCPLCNAALVFSREVKGQVLDFGTSGSLRKSDLIMYDRQTESWWQQFIGKGIVGHYNSVQLEFIPSKLIAYADFVKAYPQGEVLSRETGYTRLYGQNPFRGYDDINSSPFLFFDPHDKRLPPMERVLAVSQTNKHRIYPLTVLKNRPVINDKFGSLPLVILSKQGMLSVVDEEWIEDSRHIPAAAGYDRRIAGYTLTFLQQNGLILDEQTGTTWNLLGQGISGPLAGKNLRLADRGVHFAFAWLTFQPATEIYAGDIQHPTQRK
ncbi:MAG: DUF3179 domain-containing protein [Gammaproteobacteria bacterium]|nr:MAG: DUF3179 domain-containing protein [Gammaproteobacteria bacterium]